MKLKFNSPAGESTASFEGGEWSIIEGPEDNLFEVRLADNEAVQGGEYFPTPWDRANQVCNILGGVMLEPRPPEGESPEGAIF